MTAFDSLQRRMGGFPTGRWGIQTTTLLYAGSISFAPFEREFCCLKVDILVQELDHFLTDPDS